MNLTSVIKTLRFYPPIQLLKLKGVLLLLPFVVLTLYATSDVIREGDQAALLDAALRLASGESPWGGEFYNYDKQYLAFWLLALVFRLKSLLGLPISEIYLANLLSCLFLWSAVIAIVTVAQRGNVWLAGLVVVVAAPSFLLQIPFLSTAALSAGCLLWLTGVLIRCTGRAGLVLCGVLSFAAVGTRADAVLVLPFLLWLTAPTADLGRLLGWRHTWITFAASIAAILLGKLLVDEPSLYTNSFFFYPRIFVAYFVFGLGSAGILFLLSVLATAWMGCTSRSRRQQLYVVLGAGLMLLPFGFYGAQLLSTRYWMLTLVTLLSFISAPRGKAILHELPLQLLKRWIGWGLVAAASVPLVIGIHLPFISAPRLTLTTPTLFPTADGVMPMGAYGSFLVLRLRNANAQFVDHNQAVWQAAQATQFEMSSDGSVPILETHLPMYLRLAARLQALKSREIPANEITQLPFFYAESRSLTKEWTELNNPDGYKNEKKAAIQRLLQYPAAYQSNHRSIGVLKFGTGDTQWAEELSSLNRQFRGNEYQRFSASTCFQLDRCIPDPSDWGKTLVFYSPQPFTLILTDGTHQQPLTSVREHNASLETIALKGKDWFRRQIVLEQPESLSRLSIAKSAFPDWMSISAVQR